MESLGDPGNVVLRVQISSHGFDAVFGHVLGVVADIVRFTINVGLAEEYYQ